MNLVDYLANECHCYVSDLKYRFSSKEFQSVLLKTCVEDYPLEEWIELLEYVFNDKSCKTVEDVKVFLNHIHI